MRLLFDTHALLWWITGDPAISPNARAQVVNELNEKFVSAASVWEIAIKFKLGKLPGAAPLILELDRILAQQSFLELPISISHGLAAGALPLLHRDPFDRMLIAQASMEKLVLVSNEAIFDAYGVVRCW